jgi:hypothetical protein
MSLSNYLNGANSVESDEEYWRQLRILGNNPQIAEHTKYSGIEKIGGKWRYLIYSEKRYRAEHNEIIIAVGLLLFIVVSMLL